MKLITAVVRPAKFDAIKDALALFGVRGMTVEHVFQIYDGGGPVQIYRGQQFVPSSQPRIKIDLVVPDSELTDLTRVIGKIIGAESTQEAVWTSTIDLVVRVRTNEHGHDAI